MNQKLRELMLKAGYAAPELASRAQLLANLVIKECIEELEVYRIPVGNSRSGELACEWTYDALTEVRENIREKLLNGN